MDKHHSNTPANGIIPNDKLYTISNDNDDTTYHCRIIIVPFRTFHCRTSNATKRRRRRVNRNLG